VVPSVSILPSKSPSFLPSLNPTSTNAPTFYECSCEQGQFKFELKLKLDLYPQQTSWEIRDATGMIMFSDPGYDEYYFSNEEFNYDYCLPVGCYTFVIYDDNRDGICCSNHPYYDDGDFDDDDYLESIDGYYKGSIYGRKEIFSGGEFGRQATESFCGENVCPFATRIPSLSPSVSSLPSSAPTLLPSKNPTTHPTFLPSQNPTVTSLPSSPPTLLPSQNPTSSSAPTFYDCTCEPGQFKFELKLKLDYYPQQTSWEIRDATGMIMFSDPGYDEYYFSYEEFNYDYCLSVGCYTFVIYDDFGDGICCSNHPYYDDGFNPFVNDDYYTLEDFLDNYDIEGILEYFDGYYEGLLYGRKEVFSGGEFGSSETHYFCGEDVCA